MVTLQELTNIVIDGNTVEYNGYAEGTLDIECNDAAWGGDSPKHCHGIYISDFGCQGTDGIQITNNTSRNHGGRGIQLNGQGCSSKIDNTVITGNTLQNNSYNMILWVNIQNANISGNTFLLSSYPTTDDSDHVQIGINESPNNTFEDNDITTEITGSTIYHFKTFDSSSNTQTEFDNNDWVIQSGADNNRWIWGDSGRSDFQRRGRA